MWGGGAGGNDEAVYRVPGGLQASLSTAVLHSTHNNKPADCVFTDKFHTSHSRPRSPKPGSPLMTPC